MSNDLQLLREGVKQRSVTPSEALKRLKATGPITSEPQLVVARNWWMVWAFILLGLVIFLFYQFTKASAQARDNTQIIYLKMYQDGHWSTDFADNVRDVEFLPATIDSLLTTFAQRRFKEDRSTVSTDYGVARLFMSPALSLQFIDPAQENAIKKAADIAACVKCETKQVVVRTINHFDFEDATLGRNQARLYRSQLFLTINTESVAGAITSSSRKILAIQWRLMSRAEINTNARAKDGRDWLQVDPIGLQIVSYQLLDDPSQDDTGNK